MFCDVTLDEALTKALAKLKIDKPTPVQAKTIPYAMEKTDLLVSAATGSGKTVAFLLPTMQQLLQDSDTRTGTRALILVPTRELAQQIYGQCVALGSYTQLTFGLVIGGESFSRQKAMFRRNPEIVIATPGRLVAHLENDTPFFADLEVLILDEADRMLDMGFSDDVLAIAARCNEERQTLMFSATLGHSGIGGVASQLLRDSVVLTLDTVRDKHEHIRQQIITADDDAHKRKIAIWLLKEEKPEKALVFVNKKTQADSLAGHLRHAQIYTAYLHGDMEQHQRTHVMRRFHDGEINVLVATDVAARGIDVKGIDLVINFDMARNGKDYVHRIGRTGRAGEEGLAISLIDHNEWNVMNGVERYLKQTFERRRIKELQGTYTGPKKTKASGKAVGVKKKKPKGKDKAKLKSAQRERNKKKIGKPKKKTSADNDKARAPKKSMLTSGDGSSAPKRRGV
ncbi:MAG: DEAD/DEAH box helicase [Gammaproteobacteria bacterium]|nr:DEAD/DEAH box helicase [Gammaproteobacteria bacterium]